MKLKVKAVCSQPCGQRRFFGRFRKLRKTRSCPCVKGFGRFGCCLSDGCRYAPKAGALPTALHPVIEFFIRLAVFSQTRRDTNFAIPRYSFFCHDTMARGKNKDFSVCGHSCGQSCFYAAFGNRRKSRKRRCYKAFRRFTLLCPGCRYAPKPRALPSELHPVMKKMCLARSSLFCLPSRK